jgi:hypothetical protein
MKFTYKMKLEDGGAKRMLLDLMTGVKNWNERPEDAVKLILGLMSDNELVLMPRKATPDVTEAMRRWAYSSSRGVDAEALRYEMAVEAVHG